MTTRLPFDEVQVGIYNVLKTPLLALSPAVTIYSWTTPDDTAYPYAVISSFESVPNDTKDSATNEIVATVDVYSDSRSSTIVNQTMNSILSSLSSTDLTLTGNYNDVGISMQESCNLFPQYDESEDKVLFHGIVRYRWTIEDLNA